MKEKEVLLQEIHHRVKNNLQIISSLLSLQSSSIQDKRITDIFKEGDSRIKSMALIHEKLYQSEDLTKIGFFDYVNQLAAYLFQTYDVDITKTSLEIDIDTKCSLKIDTAVSCGLILTELISNALKYAFPDNNNGVIRVKLDIDKNDCYNLIVHDDGIGFPKEIDFRSTDTLGMQLVVMLTEQLKGTVDIGRSDGTLVRITFKTES